MSLSSILSWLSLAPKPHLPASGTKTKEIPQSPRDEHMVTIADLRKKAFLELQPLLESHANFPADLTRIVADYTVEMSSEEIWSKKELFEQARKSNQGRGVWPYPLTHIPQEYLAPIKCDGAKVTILDLSQDKEACVRPTDAFFSEVATYCPNIQTVKLQHCSQYDIAALQAFKYLSILDLSNNPFEADSIRALGTLTSLTQLNLTASFDDDEFIDPLDHLPTLQQLDKLEVLNLSKNPRIGEDVAQAAIFAAMPALKTLIIKNCSGLTTEFLAELKRLKPQLNVIH